MENVRGHTLGPNVDQIGPLYKTSHPTAREMRVLVADTFVMAATTCVDAPSGPVDVRTLILVDAGPATRRRRL